MDTPADPSQPGTGPAADPGVDRVVHEVTISSRTVVRVVAIVLATLALLWAADNARTLVSMVVVSIFFTLALLPGVNHLHERYGWRRGAAVGVVYVGGIVATALMIVVLVPGIVTFADNIRESGADWLDEADSWLEDTLGIDLIGGSQASDAATEAAAGIETWADEVLGRVLSVASSGITFLFNLATIAMFTFYLTAEFPRLQRWFLSWFAPATQERLGWTIDEAIRQTGGYFYSRLLLMVINGFGFFAVMVVLGVPVALAIPLALFGGFVSEFIPAVGTYIGGALPILITLAVQGLAAALVLLGYVIVYQQLENYVLSPRLSAKTMSLNGGVAFGAALAGGALFGPMGAFMALPVAALITASITTYRRGHEVVYHSEYARDDED